MYSAFLGYYTMFLTLPALLGLVSATFTQPILVPVFCVFNMVWSTLFLETWKRRCAALSYNWGTIRTEPFEEARPEYHGEIGINPVTGRLVRVIVGF